MSGMRIKANWHHPHQLLQSIDMLSCSDRWQVSSSVGI